MQNYTLIKKITLTDDVFELTFEGEKELPVLPGQFITFMLPKLGARSYSILKVEKNIFSFLIKRIPLDQGGKGGSVHICDLEINNSLQGIGATGHFVLQKNTNNKLFLGTGTGFVPLYNMIESALSENHTEKLHLVFGVRILADMFYLEQLQHFANTYKNFSFELYFSREAVEGHKKGYITESIDSETKNNFQEVYICGSPAMVDDAKAKLIENGCNEGNIFEEKY